MLAIFSLVSLPSTKPTMFGTLHYDSRNNDIRFIQTSDASDVPQHSACGYCRRRGVTLPLISPLTTLQVHNPTFCVSRTMYTNIYMSHTASLLWRYSWMYKMQSTLSVVHIRFSESSEVTAWSTPYDLDFISIKPDTNFWARIAGNARVPFHGPSQWCLSLFD